MLLAIDISTSIVGYSIFDGDELVHASYVNIQRHFRKHEGRVPLIKKLEYFLDEFFKDIKNYDIDRVVVEEALSKFVKGKSSAHTINSLIAFNFAIRWEIYKKLQIEPEAINVSSARKKAGIKVPKGEDKKEYITGIMENKYPELDWPKKRTGRQKDWNYDIADSIVLAHAILND